MRTPALPDLSLGLAFVAGGVFIVVQAMGFRSVPGLPVGPGLFPTITGSAMAFFGGILALQAWYALPCADDGEEAAEPAAAEHRPIPFIPGLLGAIAVAVLVMPWLGFLVTGTALTVALVRLGGGGWLAAAIFSPLATLAVQQLFVGVLRVPLPLGPLG